MVFNGNVVSIIIWTVLTIWLIIISVFLLRMIGHYNRLTKGITSTGLKEILESILKTQNNLTDDSKRLEKDLQKVSLDGGFHLQRFGLERFNPFSDTGGSQSFTMAMLDGHDNGVVMTSLYARTGNRWYVKEVHNGKGKEFELSKEEYNAIRKAQVVKRKHI